MGDGNTEIQNKETIFGTEKNPDGKSRSRGRKRR
jgi:hypothetical protein